MTDKQRLALDVAARVRGDVTVRAVEEVLSEYNTLGDRFDRLYSRTSRPLEVLTRNARKRKEGQTNGTNR